MQLTVRRLGVLSVLRVSFFIYWCLGLVGGLLYGFVFLLIYASDPTVFPPELGPMERVAGGLGVIFMLIAGLFFSILYAIFASVATALLAAVYNGLARMIGGIRMDVDAGAFTEGMPATASYPPPPPAMSPSPPPPPPPTPSTMPPHEPIIATQKETPSEPGGDASDPYDR
jgi:hypothetical protein